MEEICVDFCSLNNGELLTIVHDAAVRVSQNCDQRINENNLGQHCGNEEVYPQQHIVITVIEVVDKASKFTQTQHVLGHN